MTEMWWQNDSDVFVVKCYKQQRNQTKMFANKQHCE